MYVHVNAAVSVDGKLSSRRREQIAISGDEDFARMERLRAESDAVAIGIGTVLADDPSLERHDESLGAAPPARIVADSRARTPTDAAVLAGDRPTYVLTSEAAPADRRTALERAGATLVVAGDDRVALPDAFAALERDGIDRLLVEGGGELIFSLFEADLVDELTVYVGSMLMGGRDAPTLADGEGFTEAFPTLDLRDVSRLDDGVVLSYAV
ncbi:2,5-diamino-6-(ribosylamino)-4(3H)-pyrimidinone 5'-phosphate reductase [Halobacteriales archaeon SW_8_65_20]|nr:MAG: 2,5-diamino-6-(ribosylamino)-4(3H)-pyrimidinone 5'-phosphate reductase [Halobacteriales archaeon SW_8_65_20]